MGQRYWLWLGARLLAGLVLLVWAASYIGSGNGEKEFQKTLDAMKQVHSFRVAFTSNMGIQTSEMLWEVDCNRDIVHHQMHVVQTAPTFQEIKQDEMVVSGREYERKGDGSWSQSRYASGGTAKMYCGNLGQGADNSVMPQIATMIKRGVIQKGDKKTMNGVRCREWLVTMKGGMTGLEHDTVCIGLDDHLPYEVTVDWAHSHSTFSDYNTPLQFDLPEAAVQPASATTGSN
jgi:hypothetical protein